MAQSTAGTSFRENKLESSTNGSDWTDISGFANTVTPGGGGRNTGEFYTSDGDTAILKAGKRGPLTITANILYTEGGSDPFEVARAAYEAGTAYYLRWSPKGGDQTEFLFTSDEGILTANPYPGGDPATGAPVAFELVLATPKVTKSAVA